MALPKKKKLGQKTTVVAQRKFTDREEFQESFKKAVADIDTQDYNILTFYGVGGVGKSSLQKHLKEEHLDKDENSIYSWVNFEEASHRNPYKAFRTLANNFKSKFKIPFTVFDLAYMIYWSKAFPEYQIKKEGLPFLEEGSQLSNIVGIFSDAGGIAGTVIGTLGYVFDKAKEFSFDATIRDELKKLNALEANEIEERLGEFFAYDIDIYKEKNPSKKVVIFLDTYEALWRENSSDENQFTQDRWIREDLIANLPNILFVICGREQIAWADYEEDYKDILNQHILGNLSEKDSKSFLTSCNILDTDIQDNIYKASEGYPYYLDLCVDTYVEIEKNGQTPTVKEFANMHTNDIFKRFMQSLNKSEVKTNILYALSHARFYTKEIFQLLLGDKFTNSDMQRVNNFSFISEEDGIYYMHNIMRESLIGSPHNAEGEEVNTKLFCHYDSFLQDLDIKKVSQESIEELSEAFYHNHNLNLNNIKALYEWYMSRFQKFFETGYCISLKETLDSMIIIIEKRVDLNNQSWRDHYFKILWSAVSLHDLLSDPKALEYIDKMYPIIETLTSTNLNSIEKGEFYYKTGGYKYLNTNCVEGLRELLLSTHYMKSIVPVSNLSDYKYDEVQATLSYAYGRIGELLQQASTHLKVSKKLKRLNRALNYHKKSLRIIDILTEKYPDNIKFFTKYGVVHERLGKVYRDLNKTVLALEHLNQAKFIKQKFFEQTGKAFGYRKILIVLFDYHKTLGNILQAKNCIVEAVSTIDEKVMQSEIESKNQYFIASYLKTFERYCEIIPECSYQQKLELLRTTIDLRNVEEY